MTSTLDYRAHVQIHVHRALLAAGGLVPVYSPLPYLGLVGLVRVLVAHTPGIIPGHPLRVDSVVGVLSTDLRLVPRQRRLRTLNMVDSLELKV